MKATKFEWIKPPYRFSIESPYGSEYDYENRKIIFISTFKNVNEMTIEELKMAYRVRLVENNKYPNSGFKPAIDEEMIVIANRIKLIKNEKSK